MYVTLTLNLFAERLVSLLLVVSCEG